jgi:hypothetical protein
MNDTDKKDINDIIVMNVWESFSFFWKKPINIIIAIKIIIAK